MNMNKLEFVCLDKGDIPDNKLHEREACPNETIPNLVHLCGFKMPE